MNAASASETLVQRARRLQTPRYPALAAALEWLCRIKRLRSPLIRLICRRRAGRCDRRTFVALMQRHYGIRIGLHSYGPCLWPGRLPEGTSIGNSCSLAAGLQVLRRNHPADRISQHPFFFNVGAGLLDRDTIPAVEDNPLSIGHDAWIGQNVLVAPGCRRIGDSAIVASGAVVTADVPDFAIVGGIPAKLLRWRLPEDQREESRRSAWWLQPAAESAKHLPAFLGSFPAGEMPCFVGGAETQNAARTHQS